MVKSEQRSGLWLEPRRRNLLSGLPEPSDTEGLRGPKPIFSLPRETLSPNYPQIEAEANALLLPASSPPAERHVCPGWGGLFFKLWLLHLWFYWPLIKQLPFEAHKEANDWLDGKVRACLVMRASWLWLPSPCLASKKAPPAPGIGRVRGINSVPGYFRAWVQGPLKGRDCVLGSGRF